MSTLDRVKDIVAGQVGLQPAEVTEDKRLEPDLTLDSLDHVELMMALEEEFGIEISDEDACAWITIRDVVRYLDNRLGNPPA